MLSRALSVVAAAFFLLLPNVRSDVYMVTTTADSGPGSFRQAIQNANAHANSSANDPDQIHFAIQGPPDDVQTIAPQHPLPDITDPVVVDGFTQPGAYPNSNPVGQGLNPALRIELDGNDLVVEGNGLTITGGDATIKGLIINRFVSAILCRGGNGRNNIEGNYLGTDRTGTFAPRNFTSGRKAQQPYGVSLVDCANNRIGGREPAARNLISGGNSADVLITGPNATSNIIQGNLMGTKASGLTSLVDGGASGVTLADGASDNLIGGTVVAARNILSSSDSSGGNYSGVLFSPALNGKTAPFANRIKGNFVGLNVTGTGVIHSQTTPTGFGISLTGHHNVIGGTEPGARNIISGNRLAGILIGGDVEGYEATENVIWGNFIGTDESGALPLGNGGRGILIQSLASRNMIGGTEKGAGNRIAFTTGLGTGIGSRSAATSGTGNAILGNLIYGNEKLGIDLGLDLVTPNDPEDTDVGANNLQNYPVLKSADFEDGHVKIQGSLNSAINQSYRLEWFGDTKADGSGFGEGKVFLGAATVTTGISGVASFDVTWPCPAGTRTVSATATDPDGNTSEFSRTLHIDGTPAPQLLNISTRLRVQTDPNALIGGFIITGIDPKRVLIRALGPSLFSKFNGALADPTLDLFRNNVLLKSNDNWKETQQSEIKASGIPPGHDLEPAVVMTLTPGAYTAVIRGQYETTGIGIVEVYDLDQAVISELANISTRGLVEHSDNVMIGGLILDPPGGGSATIAVRGIGPSLSNFGISGALPDPTLELLNSEGVIVRSNNNWKESQAAEIIAAGLQPADELESALIQVVAPGSYTAIVRGTGNTTGVALVEVYRLP